MAILASFFEYAMFSDDCVTRALLAEEWAREPFISAQIPWLPFPTILIGGLVRWVVGGAPDMSLLINFFLTAFLPLWIDPLLSKLTPARRMWGHLLAATLPWALYPGISGLSEPIFWALSLGVVAGYLRDNIRLLVPCAMLVCLTRYEGWLLVGVFGAAFLLRRSRQGKGWILPLCLMSAAPMAWLLHQAWSGHLWLALTVPMRDAAEIQGSDLIPKPLMFIVMALMAAPLWIFLGPFIRKGLGEVPRPAWVFMGLLYLVTCVSGLATAVGQRNLVLPLLLFLPAIARAAPIPLMALAVLGQSLSMIHPERTLNLPLQLERKWVASCIERGMGDHMIHAERVSVIVGQGAEGYAYLGRHVASRMNRRVTLWVDQISPPDKDRGAGIREKHMPFETFGVGTDPLISYWRSNKKENRLKDLPNEQREAVLKAHHVVFMMLPLAEVWPKEHGFVCAGQSAVHGAWVEASEENEELSFPRSMRAGPIERVNLRKSLDHIRRDPWSADTLKVLTQVFLW